ncbi:hypothetical protein Pcinc_040263 [Petrolisthes cinctipes]|uniref:Uncharacterized protein n=1 Tax=Petrolisthes cinctipes TaxID=88211 RepID=A0AAE1BLS1_PETCI|nr:hypothetical protein Pcinc_040263 [Petrolisthes cinctipes]
MLGSVAGECFPRPITDWILQSSAHGRLDTGEAGNGDEEVQGSAYQHSYKPHRHHQVTVAPQHDPFLYHQRIPTSRADPP